MATGSDAAISDSFDYSQLKLPTVSQHGLEVVEIINSEDVQFNLLEAAILKDTMLTGIMLKYANSPMYRRFVEVTNVRNAISILGVDNVKSAVMISTMRAYCEPTNPAKELIWVRTSNLASAAKLIAKKRFRRLSDDIELTALMTEMGALVLSSNYDSEYATVIESALDNSTRWSKEESRVFGSDRAELTRYVLEKLRLPEITINALADYFNDIQIENLTEDVDKHHAVLSLANKLVFAYERNFEDYILDDDEHVVLLGFSDQEIQELHAEFAEMMEEKFMI